MAVVLTIIIFVICGLIAVRQENIKEEKKNRLEEIRPYAHLENGLFKALELKKRSSVLDGAFSIEAERNVNLSYTPDKLVYTGATVGGITTGGFHVEQGGYSVSSGAKNGKYNLYFKYADYYGTPLSQIVSTIKMNAEDYEYAKKKFRFLICLKMTAIKARLLQPLLLCLNCGKMLI